MLCDAKGNGFLSVRIKNLRAQHRQSQSANGIASNESAGAAQIDVQEEDGDFFEAVKNDLEFLKTVKLNDDNMNIIKSKIAATSDYRRKFIRENHAIDLLEHFPYFFYNQKLVSDFISLYCLLLKSFRLHNCIYTY